MSKTSDKPKSFESAIAELEAIVGAMESPDLPLEQAIAQYERGIKLLRFCEETLGDAERKIQILENNQLKPFKETFGETPET
ncbi:MAG: exodeoxyribonuclease VII small subunit [Betaproteobacteria bacterium]|nr:exodeoxyribonuclease VII small subunit [Betaproteobacteria bacterium]